MVKNPTASFFCIVKFHKEESWTCVKYSQVSISQCPWTNFTLYTAINPVTLTPGHAILYVNLINYIYGLITWLYIYIYIYTLFKLRI